MDQPLGPTLAEIITACPRCHSKDNQVIHTAHTTEHNRFDRIQCGCGVVGPYRRDIALAVAAWKLACEQPIAEPIHCECADPNFINPKQTKPTRTPPYATDSITQDTKS